MSLRRSVGLLARTLAVVCLCLPLTAAVPVVATQPPAVHQQTATTPTDGTAATNSTSDGGIVGTVTGLLGGVGSFLFGSTIGHALVGVPLGIYLGLKTIAVYLERYE